MNDIRIVAVGFRYRATGQTTDSEDCRTRTLFICRWQFIGLRPDIAMSFMLTIDFTSQHYLHLNILALPLDYDFESRRRHGTSYSTTLNKAD